VDQQRQQIEAKDNRQQIRQQLFKLFRVFPPLFMTTFIIIAKKRLECNAFQSFLHFLPFRVKIT